jgi:glutamyl-tRNA synthetase/glutamyl-Q tRNA(Asp) synthetase
MSATTIVTRFAPAPTGFLHLGHVVNAIYVWGVARAQSGRVLLRIEDHDRQRSRTQYERALIEDLEWLGFTPDAPQLDCFRDRPCEGRQSDRGDVYEAALADLRAKELVYACECSRSRISWTAGATAGERRYAGTCAAKGLPDQAGFGIRVRLAPSTERFVDLRLGPQEQQPWQQCGDVLVRDREGQWTYQFAAAVDDYRQGVTLVVRGEDLLPSTGRQIQLARLLGRVEPPAFFHHPLIMKTATQKLSKADGDTGVRELRARGWSPERVIGHAAALVGLAPTEQPIGAHRVQMLF